MPWAELTGAHCPGLLCIFVGLKYMPRPSGAIGPDNIILRPGKNFKILHPTKLKLKRQGKIVKLNIPSSPGYLRGRRTGPGVGARPKLRRAKRILGAPGA